MDLQWAYCLIYIFKEVFFRSDQETHRLQVVQETEAKGIFFQQIFLQHSLSENKAQVNICLFWVRLEVARGKDSWSSLVFLKISLGRGWGHVYERTVIV